MDHKGDLQCVSPDEIKMAYMRAMARDIGASVGDDVVKGWCRTALKHLDTEDDLFFYAFNLRERLVNDFPALARTALQGIHEVAQFRERKLVT